MLFNLLHRFAGRLRHRRQLQFGYVGKKQFEGWLAIILMVWFSPLALLLILAVWILDGRPIFFTQVRYSKNRKLFRIVKFRTMRQAEASDSENEQWKPCAKNITRLGWWLRALKLDELPQLYVNVFYREDINLIGPRPWQLSDANSAEKIHPRLFAGRLEMPGGLLGLSAAIFGRPQDQRSVRHTMFWDRFYCRNSSLLLDCLIVVLTVIKPILNPIENRLQQRRVS